MRKYLRAEVEFREKNLTVRKGVFLPLLWWSVDVLSLLFAEKIPSEYSNNRNPLMSQIDLVEDGQWLQLLSH